MDIPARARRQSPRRTFVRASPREQVRRSRWFRHTLQVRYTTSRDPLGSVRSHPDVLNRTCKIGNQTLIGSKSQIADNAQIIASVLGQRCMIGAGSVVRNSYLFDGVVVGPNCVIEYSIVGAGVQIKEESRVERGCLIADKVIIGPTARLEPFQKLLKKSQDNEEEEDEEEEDEGDEAADENEDDEADDEEEDDEDEDDEEDESEEQEDDSDYEEVAASEHQSEKVCLILMSCFRSRSRCARKTRRGVQCNHMA